MGVFPLNHTFSFNIVFLILNDSVVMKFFEFSLVNLSDIEECVNPLGALFVVGSNFMTVSGPKCRPN
jgi:hypothetical protein